jgi:hypothetical protein
MAGEIPTALDIDRQVQCVAPEGFSCWVRRTISAIFAAEIIGFRPRHSRTWPSLANPQHRTNVPVRRARTVTGVIPTLTAI